MTTPPTETISVTAERAPRSRRAYTAQEKADYLALFEKSEMRQADFCREMGLNGSTFSIWIRARRGETKTAASSMAEPQFAQVRLSAPMSTTAESMTVTVHLPSGAKIEVSPVTDALWQGLGLLLKTLQS